jgi:hypothetical protein
MLKRLYWTGHPVFEQQDAASVGIAWPGDERSVPGTEPVYYPHDEYNALQAGVPVALFLTELRQRNPSAVIDVIAHSLGNMVVHSALKLSGSRTIDRYVMIDAAVPAEALDAAYEPDAGERTQMELAARINGYPDDTVWIAQWRRMIERADEPACGPNILDCTRSHYQRWQEKLRLVNPRLKPLPDYAVRWRKARDGSSPWRGFFDLRAHGPAVYNVYNHKDRVLRIDTDAPPSAWRASQIAQKPKVPGLLSVLPRDNEITQYWALLDNTSAAEEYLWAVADPQQDHSSLTRQWAELAFWFQPLSGAVGSMPLRGMPPERNVDMADVGGGDGPLEYVSSHTYPTQKPLAEVWKLYETIRALLN